MPRDFLKVRICKCVTLSNSERKPEVDGGFLWLLIVLDEFRCIHMKKPCADGKAVRCERANKGLKWRAGLCAPGRCTDVASHREAAAKAGICGLHHTTTVCPQRACYQHSAGMSVLSMQIARPRSRHANLSAVCRQQMIADSRFAKGSWSHRAQAV